MLLHSLVLLLRVGSLKTADHAFYLTSVRSGHEPEVADCSTAEICLGGFFSDKGEALSHFSSHEMSDSRFSFENGLLIPNTDINQFSSLTNCTKSMTRDLRPQSR